MAGNFSAYWLGMAMLLLMSIGYFMSTMMPVGASAIMLAPAVFAFGLVAFGFLGMGPVTIAVDSYGPVTDNAQSVYELSTIETIPGIEADMQKNFGFKPDFEKAKENLEENDGAGNTFKATSKPVLIGTAVVGATTMIFSTIVALTNGLQGHTWIKISLMHAPFLLGLIAGGAVIYWFTGASAQAVTTGAYRRWNSSRRTSSSIPPKRRPSRIPRRWSKSARSTRRRACSTSSWWSSSPPSPSRSWSRSSSSAT